MEVCIDEKLIGRSFLIEEKGEDMESHPYEVRVINVAKSCKYVHFEYNDYRMVWKRFDKIFILEEVFRPTQDVMYTNIAFIDGVSWIFDNVLFADRSEFTNNVEFMFYIDVSPNMIPDLKINIPELEKFLNNYDISKAVDGNQLAETIKSMCTEIN